MNNLFVSILLSILPVSELRGGIPFAIANNINPVTAFFLCTAANIAIIPLIFLFLNYLHCHLLKISFYKKTFNVFLNRIRKRQKKVEYNYETYGVFALTIFTAIPLPVTGAWTAVIIAWLLNLKKKRSMIAIALGVIIAGIIITFATTGIINTLKLFL